MSILWEIRGRVGVATIDRQERRNALDAEHCDVLRRHLEDDAADLRVIVITGAGKAFCAGADLGTRFEAGAHRSGEAEEGHDTTDEGDPFHAVLQRLLDGVAGHRLPVIAAVNGPALGAGTQLATACDLRVAGEDALFGIPAAKLGIMISAASTERLVRLVGHGVTSEMLITGRRYDAADALRTGLVHRVVADPLADGLAWADEISDLAPLSVQGHKESLNVIAGSGGLDDAGRTRIGELIERAVTSDDLREGIAAFGEKRTPKFEGR